MGNDKPKSVWPAWELIDPPIGKGGNAVVYQGIKKKRKGAKQYSAVKIPKSDSVYFYEKLKNEIDTIYKLKDHPNIVKIHDYKQAKNGLNIRMELLEKFEKFAADVTMQSECDIIRRNNIIRLAIDICCALETCMQYKPRISHRDIKPDNIFFSRAAGKFKLGDFGEARELDKGTITDSISVRGTYHYIAPEAHNHKKYSIYTDIYSLGVVLYKLSNNGKIPFSDTPAPSDAELMAAVSKRNDPNARTPMPPPENASGEWAEIILKACAFEPKERFKDAAALKKALKNIYTPAYGDSLISLLNYKITNAFSKEDIIKLGIDICAQIESCEKQNNIITHINIRPDNIAFSENSGKFELNDSIIFAEGSESSAAAEIHEPRNDYISPEAYHGQPDFNSAAADIYSLGMVLYELANDNKLPFCKLKNKFTTSSELEKAFNKRMNNKKMAPPVNAGKELAEAILKACGFNPEKRFESIAEFKEALEKARFSARKDRKFSIRKIAAAAGFSAVILFAGVLSYIKIQNINEIDEPVPQALAPVLTDAPEPAAAASAAVIKSDATVSSYEGRYYPVKEPDGIHNMVHINIGVYYSDGSYDELTTSERWHQQYIGTMKTYTITDGYDNKFMVEVIWGDTGEFGSE